jgi:hypothetical protein
MFSKPFAVALLAAACIAAAGGGYVAVRQNSPAAADALADARPAPSPVHETEGVISPESPEPPEPEAAGIGVPIERLNPPADRTAGRPTNSGPSRADERPRRAAPVPDRKPTAPIEREAAPLPATRPATTATAPTGNRTSAPPAAPPAPAQIETGAAAVPVEQEDLIASRSPAAPDPALSEEARPNPGSAGPARTYEELVVPAAAVMGLQIETPVSSERARLEDRVEARVTRDVLVDGRTAVPAGARAIGAVTLVERGGKVKERARLGVRFHTLVLADGTTLPLRTEPILREGDSPAGDSSRKIGGAAVGGAILGAIMGGKKGAIVGGATGAAGGTAVVLAGDRNPATLQPGTVVTVRLSAPLPVSVEKR